MNKLKEKTNLKQQRKGISLIVLVITIIVVIVLATAVILSIANNNPIENAKKAVFLNDMKEIEDEVNMYALNKYTDKYLENLEEETRVNVSGDEMVSLFPSTEKYKEKIEIINGKIVLTDKATVDEYEWASEINIFGFLEWDGSADTSWYNNSSTEFEIYTAEELAGLAKLVNEGTENFEGKTINLMNDIELGGYEWEPIGGNTYSFSGNFYGNGHEIAGMEISESEGRYAGLFGRIESSIIDGVILEYSYISSNASFVGGIVGEAASNYEHSIQSKIINCASIGNRIEGTKTIGGIAGDLYDAQIISCYNASYVRNTSQKNNGNLTGWYYQPRAGGICGGGIDGSQIYNCYNIGTIVAQYTSAGGIVGGADAYTLFNCYNIGEVSGASYGEIVALGGMGTDIEDCYCLNIENAVGDTYRADISEDDYGITNIYSMPQSGLKATDLNMNGYTEYVDDTNNINRGYPILSWQE